MLEYLIIRRANGTWATTTVNRMPIVDIENELIRALDVVIPRYLAALRTAIAEAEGPDRLTMPQMRCLQVIAQNRQRGAITSRLAEATNVTVPTMSAMIDG